MTSNQRWQVVQLAYGAVRPRCSHRTRTVASWCCAIRNRFRPWWEMTGPRHDIRQETR